MEGRAPNIGELLTPPPPISTNTPTAVTAFIDFFNSGPAAIPTTITSFVAFQQTFGGLNPRSEASYQIQQFFNTGGQKAIVLRIPSEPSMSAFAANLQSALTTLDIPFNLLSIPATSNLSPADMHAVMFAAESFCTSRSAFYVADIPPSVIIATPAAMEAWFATPASQQATTPPSITLVSSSLIHSIKIHLARSAAAEPSPASMPTPTAHAVSGKLPPEPTPSFREQLQLFPSTTSPPNN